MVENTVTFSFADDDEFAEIEWSFSKGVLTLDGDKVSPKGLEYLILYGLKQTLQDSWASHSKSKDTVKAEASYAKRLKSVIEGTIEAGTRATNPVAVEAGRLARLAVDKAIKPKYKDRKGFESAKGKGAYTKAWKAYVQKQGEALQTLAKANVEAATALEATID